ncbi:MAG: hypothetical protein MK008_05770 [Bdellovibrionales bacterium]|nr:hypothetical protein [Bdellovibrionales bacterium]
MSFLIALVFSSYVYAGVDNINIASAVDIINPISLDESKENKTQVRSAELLLYGPVDHLFSGQLNIAGHNEGGEFVFELHEGFISSNSLIPKSEIKIGKFLLDIGRLNNVHQHDWLFTTAPKVHREFLHPGSDVLEAEGASDTGIEYSLLVPGQELINVKVGVTNGECFGHCHEDGLRPSYPLHYLRVTGFIPESSQTGWLIGGNYLSRIEGGSTKTKLYGMDLTYKQRQGAILKWLSQSEFYYQWQQSPVETTYKSGFYSYLQYGFSKQLFLGMRFDGFSHLNMKFETNSKGREDFDYALSPSVTYKPSEFSLVRLSYLHEVNTTQGVSDTKNRQVQLQFVYFLGAHPAHIF